MEERAFKVLGIQPTGDRRIIREAFLRLARIYHPDRFVGQPADVREEAERRMKEATVAYEALSGKHPTPRSAPAFDAKWGDRLEEEAKKRREEAARRRREQQQTEARWRRWDEIERQARERAEWVASSVQETPIKPEPDRTVDISDDGPRRSALSIRLDEARSKSDQALEPRPATDG